MGPSMLLTSFTVSEESDVLPRCRMVSGSRERCPGFPYTKLRAVWAL